MINCTQSANHPEWSLPYCADARRSTPLKSERLIVAVLCAAFVSMGSVLLVQYTKTPGSDMLAPLQRPSDLSIQAIRNEIIETKP